MRTKFWALQFVVSVIVIYAVLRSPGLKKTLVGDEAGLPSWLTVSGAKIQFI